MNAFHRVILSSSDNPKYIESWPLVAETWKAMFGVPVWLAFIGTEEREEELKLKAHGSVVTLKPVEGIPVANQAKVARYFLAAKFGSYDCRSPSLLNDIDLLPLDRDHVLRLVGNRTPGSLVTVGHDLYKGPEAGKFTAGFLTAECNVFTKIVNPTEMDWPSFIQSLVGIQKFDHKEDISNPTNNEHPDCFSDESLWRYWLWKTPTPVEHRPMPFWPYELQALDRCGWQFDQAKLDAGVYKEAHLPRPFSQNLDKIQPLIDYLTKKYGVAKVL